MKGIRILLVTALLGLTGCNHPSRAHEIKVQLSGQVTDTGERKFGLPNAQLFTSEYQWSRYLGKDEPPHIFPTNMAMCANGTSCLPIIDWDKQEMIYFTAEFLTGGYSFANPSVELRDGKIVTHVDLLSPGKNCFVTQSIADIAYAVVIDHIPNALGKPVINEKQDRSC